MTSLNINLTKSYAAAAVMPHSRIRLQRHDRCGFCRRFNLSWRHKTTHAEYCFQHGLQYFKLSQLIPMTVRALDYQAAEETIKHVEQAGTTGTTGQRRKVKR